MSYSQIGPLRMYHEVSGAGAPLLLLHGGGSSAETTFGTVMPTLAKQRLIVAPEQQGHGHTADIARPFSFAVMADDTVALLDQLGIEKTDVCGFSHGANVALQIALRHPKRVRRLILASGFFKKDGFPEAFWEGQRRASAADMPPLLRNAYLKDNPEPQNLDTLVKKCVELNLEFKDIPDDVLRSVALPTLVMIADRDVIRLEHAVEMVRLLPDARLAVFPGSEHGTYLGEATASKKNPVMSDAAAAMILDFLEE